MLITMRINGLQTTKSTLLGIEQPVNCEYCNHLIDYGDNIYNLLSDDSYHCSENCVTNYIKENLTLN